MPGGGVLKLERVDPAHVDWAELDARPEQLVFQTREWLEFIARTQHARPVVAAVNDGGERLGWFAGAVIRRFGVSILGSPFPGWSTGSMGFTLDEGASRLAAVEALVAFAFGELRVLHLELKDRRLRLDDAAGLGFEFSTDVTFDLDLTADEDVLFGRMTSACRRCIRKAERVGVVVEEATGLDFADEYYAQLLEVFGRQGLKPAYGVERVRELIRTLGPTGRLLLLRARNPEGESIATGIFPGMNRMAFFWGGASRREHQILRPNEAMFWYAMRWWKRRGIAVLDMGGGGEYKRKYGPVEVAIPFFRKSRVVAVGRLRQTAERVARRRRT